MKSFLEACEAGVATIYIYPLRGIHWTILSQLLPCGTRLVESTYVLTKKALQNKERIHSKLRICFIPG